MTTVINLISGPGSGKSTLAAELYANMKRRHLDVEIVREVAKEWAYEGKKIGPFEQIAIIGEQIKKESSLFGKVNYIVTDSPTLLGAFYFEHNHGPLFMNKMVKNYYDYSERNGITFLNYIIPRYGIYDNKGRFESEEEAKEIDTDLWWYLSTENYTFKNFADQNNNIMSDDILNLIIKDVLNG